MANNLAASRPYQIVVWGASGFTGRLVAEHIARDYHGRIKWALAGRDKAKLEAIRAGLVKINEDCKVRNNCQYFERDGSSTDR